ncbi:MAG TPA: LPXTG cell wall anchor domain-containing protein [Streptosporangiaceae bacterium]|nr:LPXTG cell wall anchor domain-containing protein [Streptosporangiaceae bacterium]
MTVTVTHTSSVTAPPATGGGGTAGLQDGSLFALGGVAILAAAGSFGYRRRLIRKR